VGDDTVCHVVTASAVYAAVDKSTQTEPAVPSIGQLGCAIRHTGTGRLILLLPSAGELASHPPAGGVKSPTPGGSPDTIAGLGPVLYRFKVDAHGNPLWDMHGELLREPFTAPSDSIGSSSSASVLQSVKWHTVLPVEPLEHEGIAGWLMQTAGRTCWFATDKIVSIQLVLMRDALRFHDCPHDILAMVAMRNAMAEAARDVGEAAQDVQDASEAAQDVQDAGTVTGM
jgi:hypothetical protein